MGEDQPPQVKVEVTAEAGEILVIVQQVEGAPEDIWGCLTNPDCFKLWWHEHVQFDARLDGQFVEPWRDPTGQNKVTRAQVTAYHPPVGFVMVWADEDWTFDTVVSVSLKPVDGGTEVTVEHQGWHLAPEAARGELMQQHRAGWSRHLASLAAHANEHHARRKGH